MLSFQKIKRVVGHTNLSMITKPVQLAGNFKVLELRERGGRIVKVDGPGFIIDELFKHFFLKMNYKVAKRKLDWNFFRKN